MTAAIDLGFIKTMRVHAAAVNGISISAEAVDPSRAWVGESIATYVPSSYFRQEAEGIEPLSGFQGG